jgi:cation:H+ antiporter
MSALLSVWLQFAFCTAVIGVAGFRLSRYGDALAQLTRLSRSWVGLVLVATVTSLPELVTGLSAVTVAQAPDIALGDALGSCVFNLAILAFVDAFHRRAPIYSVMSTGHILPAALGLIMLIGVALILVLSEQRAVPAWGHVSWGSIVLVLAYLLTIRLLFNRESGESGSGYSAVEACGLTLKQAVTGYVLAAAVIVASGLWLPLLAVEIARQMSWSNTFVGTLFVAMATSVPELATTLGALQIGAIDLAVGNLLGSNLFDVLIVALDDIAYQRGPLFEAVSRQHVISALTAALMSAVVIAALVYKPTLRVLRVASWGGIALAVLYVLNALLQFQVARNGAV